MSKVILRLPDVIEQIGLSRSSIYQKMAEGSFPKPIRLGKRAVGWLKKDIDNWLENKILLKNLENH